MLTASVVTIVLMLGNRGEEPRSQKFVGALLAQAEVRVNESAAQQELAELTRSRTSLLVPGLTVAIGGALTGAGGLFLLAALIGGGSYGAGSVVLVVVGLACLGVGIAGMVIGIVAMAVMGNARDKVDERIRALERSQPRSVPREESGPPPSVLNVSPNGLLLANF